MFAEIINAINTAFAGVLSFFMSFNIDDGFAYIFLFSMFAFYSVYRFLLRPFFYGGASDTVSKKNKSKKR